MRAGAKTPAARAAQRLLIGPWAHSPHIDSALAFGSIGQVQFGVHSWPTTLDVGGLHLRWYDRHLRDMDNGIETEAPINLFVMGTNVWREEHEWPLARTRYVAFFLHRAGRANSLRGDGLLTPEESAAGAERPDTYLYHPLAAVPTVGGQLCCSPTWSPSGVFDQRAVEERADVLVYTTPPLERPLEVTGPAKVVLYAASTAVDTDFTAKLVDVCPCGCARNLTDGIIRARYRNSPATETRLTPGQVEAYEIDLGATSNVFLPGHRIRLEIASSNFPRFDRNPNTGAPIAIETDVVPAMQTVFHDRERPSRLVLPVIEGGSSPT
jgi:putative CocE/NonD family hydrolase